MENQTQSLAQSRKTEFLITSFALYFCYISYGLCYNIWGPTWVDLVNLLNSTQNDMAYGNSLMAVGYTVGAFSGGFLFNYMNRQLLVAFYLILMAFATTLTPIFKSYTLFLVFALIFGLGEGGFDTGCNAWVLEMWQSENGPYMQAMYFTFGLGSLLAPLISFKFLNDNTGFGDSVTNTTIKTLNREHSVKNMTLGSPQFGAHHNTNFYIYSTKLLTPLTERFNGSLNTNSNDNTTSGINSSDIYIPYCITGGLLVISALIIIIMYFIKKYEPILDNSDNEREDQNCRKSSKVDSSDSISVSSDYSEDNNDRTELLNNNIDSKHSEEDNISKKYLYSMVSIGCVMFMFYEGMENINFEYLETFYVNTKLNLSENTSDLIVSSMSAAYTIGRGIGIFMAIKVEPKYFLYCDLILISVANAILYFFADTSETMVIIGTVILGLGFSTVFPCIYSYLERHIRLTNQICGLLMVSCASIATVDPIIVGRYISDYPYILLYVNIGSTVLVIIAFMCIEITTTIRRNRIKTYPKINRSDVSTSVIEILP